MNDYPALGLKGSNPGRIVAPNRLQLPQTVLQNAQWEDLKITPGRTFAGGTVPPNIAWKSTLRMVVFGIGDELFFNEQLPHSYKEGSDLRLHLHWTPHARGTAENGNTVNWRADITVISINGVFPAEITYNLTGTCDGVNDKHLLVPSVTISGTGLTISSEIAGRIYRAGGDSWSSNTPNTNLPGFLEMDIHYQKDTPGSVNETSKL